MTGVWARIAASALGVAAGAVCLVVVLRGVDVEAVWASVRDGRWGLPALEALAGTLLFVLAKVVRWRMLLGSPPDLPARRLAAPVLGGLALNALFPHAGEFVRAAALQRQAGRAASGVLSSIVAERVFDLFGVLILGSVALDFVPVNPALRHALRLIGMLAAALAAAIIAALVRPDLVERAAARGATLVPARARRWLLTQVSDALAGLAPVRSARTSVRVLLLSVVQWMAVAVAVHGCGAVVGIAIGVAATCLVVVGIVVAFLLPNAPGYTGSVQVAFLVTLSPLGVADEAALAASVVYQLLMILPLIIAGLACIGPMLARR